MDKDAEEVSKFIEEAVYWRMVDNDVQTIKDRNQDMSAEELQAIIDNNVIEERKAMNGQRHSASCNGLRSLAIG